MSNPLLGNITLPNTTERISKSNKLFHQPLPTNDSDRTILLDIFGVSRRINIKGKFVGSISEQKSFIESIENIINGKQEGTIYTSGKFITKTFNVFVNTLNYYADIGTAESLEYDLELLEGTDTITNI